MTLPVLYSFRRCPYAMRARLAIAASGNRVALREVKLAAKPEAMLAASPKGTVPVLVLPGGQVIAESLDVMRWALGRHDPERWLDRDDPALIERNDGAFKHNLDRYKYPERYGYAQASAEALAHRERALGFLRDLDTRLARQDQLGAGQPGAGKIGAGQLCGAVRGLADMAIMPFVRQFAAVDPAWFASLPLPHLQRWLEEHLASALFGAVMGRFAPWREGDAPVIFPAL